MNWIEVLILKSHKMYLSININKFSMIKLLDYPKIIFKIFETNNYSFLIIIFEKMKCI